MHKQYLEVHTNNNLHGDFARNENFTKKRELKQTLMVGYRSIFIGMSVTNGLVICGCSILPLFDSTIVIHFGPNNRIAKMAKDAYNDKILVR